MDKKHRERLVGILVVIAIVVIVIPAFFYHSRQAAVVQEQTPPPMPQVTAQTVQKVTPVAPVHAEVTVPEAWAVQVATFSSTSRAKTLMQHLVRHHYKAFTAVVNKKICVYVGPVLDKTKANALMNELKKTMHLQGIIVPYKTGEKS